MARRKKKLLQRNQTIITKRKQNKPGLPGLKAFALLATFLMASYAAIASYKNHYDTLTDLSVIGNGVPVVVQVHDPSCPSCRKLKSNTESALARVKGDLQYRIADLHSSTGRLLARKYHAQKVTLLTFDAKGEFLDSHVGIQSVDALESLFRRLATTDKRN